MLCAADYGDCTTRRRLFIQARKKPAKITWPEPTHTRVAENATDGGGEHGATKVDAPISTITTKARHALVEPELTPFLVHSGGPRVAERQVTEPLPTLLTREHFALVEPVLTAVDKMADQKGQRAQPFLVTVGGPEGQGRQPKSVDDPLPTVLTENHTAVVEPFLTA